MTRSPDGTPSAAHDVHQLQPLVEEVISGLKNQQDLLKMRGMTLPPDSLQGLGALQQQLARLETSLGDDTRELHQLRALVATSAIINSSLDLDTVLANAMDEVINLTGAERGYIVLRQPDTGELEIRVARNREPDAADGYQISSTILNEVMTSGDALLTDNAYKDPRMQHSETIAQFGLRSVLCVPLQYRQRVIGAVYVDNRFRAAVFSARELNLLMAFANQIAVALQNARLYADLQTSLDEITEMKALVENVFASIGSGVVTTDAQDCVTTFNPAATAILRRDADQVIGQPVAEALPVLSQYFEPQVQTVLQDNDSLTIEATPDLPERGRVVLNLRLSPLKDAAQQTQGVALVLDDLTEEREREAILNLMRRYLPPGMMDNIQHISQLALGGERREVTCLFADVCPLAIFPPDLRPHEIMDLLNRYMTRATDAVHQHNGLLDKYNGSEIMVLFNTQLNPQPDHAAQALLAALELRRDLDALYQELGRGPEEHFYRIGVHSGVATLGNVGSARRRSFTAIGDTINLAKRLQEYAQPGQIIVSEDTLRAIGNVDLPLELAEHTPIQAKGRQQTTAIYEVLGH